MPLGKAIADIFGKGAGNIIESVGNVADKFITTKQEKAEFEAAVQQKLNEHLQVMEAEATKQMDIIVKENESARNREVQIATSQNAPLLNKIISPLLALLILGSTFLMWYIIMFKDIDKNKEVIISGIIGSLTTLSMGVVSYYFGSSIGSKQKSDLLDKLAK